MRWLNTFAQHDITDLWRAAPFKLPQFLSYKKYSFELRLQQWPCFSFAVRGPLSVGWNYQFNHLLNNGYYYFLSQELDHLGHLFSSLPASQTASDQLQQTWYVNKNIPAPAFQRRFMNKHLALFSPSVCVSAAGWDTSKRNRCHLLIWVQPWPWNPQKLMETCGHGAHFS